MDTQINDIILKLQKVQKMLIECYQADSVGQTEKAVKLALDINGKLIDSNLNFAIVSEQLIRKNLNSKNKLKVVK